MDSLINLNLRQVRISKTSREALIEKLSKELSVYQDLILSIECEINNLSTHKGSKTNYSVRFLVKVPQALLRIKKEGSDIYLTFDKALEYLLKHIKDYKNKVKRWHNNDQWIDSQIVQDIADDNISEEETLKYNDYMPVVRVKHLKGIPPMSISEAIFKMEMLGRQSFLFQNVETNLLELIYTDNNKYVIIRPPQTL